MIQVYHVCDTETLNPVYNSVSQNLFDRTVLLGCLYPGHEPEKAVNNEDRQRDGTRYLQREDQVLLRHCIIFVDEGIYRLINACSGNQGDEGRDKIDRHRRLQKTR